MREAVREALAGAWCPARVIPPLRCWQLLQPLQQLCCKEQLGTTCPGDAKTRAASGPGAPCLVPDDSQGAEEVTTTGHQAPGWRGMSAHASQFHAHSGPPRAGTGCWHPHPPCHAPMAREGPARLNINPGAASRAPWRRTPSTPETPAMRGLRVRYQLLVSPS